MAAPGTFWNPRSPYQSTGRHQAIVGDPQGDAGPNPELVEAYGPIRVTPLRNLSGHRARAAWAGLPHDAYGSDDDEGASDEGDDDDEADDENEDDTPEPASGGDSTTGVDEDYFDSIDASTVPPAPPKVAGNTNWPGSTLSLPGYDADAFGDAPKMGPIPGDDMPPPLLRPDIHTDAGSLLQPARPLPPPTPPPPYFDFHTDPNSLLQPKDSFGQAPPIYGPGTTAVPSIVDASAFQGKGRRMPYTDKGRGWLNANRQFYPPVPQPPRPYFQPNPDSYLQRPQPPQALATPDFSTDPYNPLQPGSRDPGTIAADLAPPVPSSTARLDDSTLSFGRASGDIPPPAPASFMPPMPMGPTRSSDAAARDAFGLEPLHLDDETAWGPAGPSVFSAGHQLAPLVPDDGFLKPIGPDPKHNYDALGIQNTPASPLFDPNARNLDTFQQHEDYTPNPKILRHALWCIS